MKKYFDIFRKTKAGKLFHENQFILLSFFCSILMSLLIAFCFDLVPFGDKTILRMDLYHQYGPLFAELFERVKHGDSMLYSWCSGGGSSFLGNFYNYLSSPLSLCIFLFGHKNITEAISFMIFAKACFSSATFTYYLKKSQKKSSYITSAFGVLYAFSGYFIAYYWDLMWLDAMALLPLVVLGIEKIINKGKPGLYIGALALVMFSNYYMAYMTCLFAVIYFVFYYFSKFSLTDKLYDYKTPFEKRTKLDTIRTSRFISSGAIFAFGSAVAGMIIAFSLIPTYFILQSCSATSGTFPEGLEMYNNVFDFIANHLASLEPTIRSSGEDVLPNVYCGIMTVMLVPLFYFTKSIKLKEKISYTVLLGVLFLSFNTNYLNYIWHGFHFPNDLPYRFSFMYTFIILVIGFKALVRIKEFKPKEILGLGLGSVMFIVIVEKIGSKNVNSTSVFISLVFAIIYTIVFYTLSSKKYDKAVITLFLLCAVLSEYAISSTNHYEMNQTKTHYASDLKSFNEAKASVDNYNGNDSYRMELTDLRTRMDPCWYYYNGISTFSSMAYEKLSNLQQNLGLAGNFINSYTYNMQTPVYNAMFSLDYIMDNSDKVEMNEELFKLIGGNSTFKAYKNNYSLPLAYMVNSKITTWEYGDENPFQVQNEYFELATGVKDVLEHEDVDDINCYNVSDIENFEGLDYFYFDVMDSEITGEITLTLSPKETKNYYLYVDCPSIDQVQVSVGERNIVQDMDDEYYILDLGLCKKNELIAITLPTNEGTESDGATFQLYSLNKDKFEKGYEILKSGSLQDQVFDNTNISGTVKADKSGVLYTSIPYDESWKVTVDGKEVNKSDIIIIGNALLGVKLNEGEHDVSFKYTPKGLSFGLVVSLAGILLLLAYIFIFRKTKIYKDYSIMFDPHSDEERTLYYLNRIKMEKEIINSGNCYYESTKFSDEELNDIKIIDIHFGAENGGTFVKYEKEISPEDEENDTSDLTDE